MRQPTASPTQGACFWFWPQWSSYRKARCGLTNQVHQPRAGYGPEVDSALDKIAWLQDFCGVADARLPRFAWTLSREATPRQMDT